MGVCRWAESTKCCVKLQKLSDARCCHLLLHLIDIASPFQKEKIKLPKICNVTLFFQQMNTDRKDVPPLDGVKPNSDIENLQPGEKSFTCARTEVPNS